MCLVHSCQIFFPLHHSLDTLRTLTFHDVLPYLRNCLLVLLRHFANNSQTALVYSREPARLLTSVLDQSHLESVEG